MEKWNFLTRAGEVETLKANDLANITGGFVRQANPKVNILGKETADFFVKTDRAIWGVHINNNNNWFNRA
jgi:hypothetical protein